jgi:diguanylate cyclase (GGDEF)-like protein
MPDIQEKKIYRTFFISTGLLIFLVLSGVFLDMEIRTRKLINEENLIRARALFKAVLLTRKWNAKYGGVYVEKKQGVQSNPYLEHPDIKAVDGKIYTLRNPALMTRELSEFAEKENLFNFRITSLHPINPNNIPDAFEKSALEQFEAGKATEAYRTELIKDRAYFRYMAPLYIENDCLECHKQQLADVGDVNGGISVSLDIEDLQQKIRHNMYFIALFGLITVVLVLGLVYFFTKKLIRKLAEARALIERIAVTDVLTGLFNRRHVLSRFVEEFEKSRRQGKPLACIIADIDHFKAVNDSFGHLAGDEVLKEVSHRIKQSIRIYDILGRYGGEEFLILLPGADLEQAWNFAERMRMHVRGTMILDKQVTVSLGVTSLQEGDQSIDDMIKRADEALYKAKNAGRDRVEWIPGR